MKKKSVKRAVLGSAVVVVVLMSATAYLSVRVISTEDPRWVTSAQLLSKATIMKVLDRYRSLTDPETYAPTPFDSASFRYADLSHPYFAKVRSDKRIAHFYRKANLPVDFDSVIAMREYLRSLFRHGTASRDYINTNVLEMIDAAENGERFVCGDITKMLAQLIQAGGTQARLVGLRSAHSDHIVVEFWSRRYGKWVAVDPDYNVHYTNAEGIPLSVAELFESAQDTQRLKHVRRVAGTSPNTLYNKKSRLLELFYKNGFAVYFYNRWVDQNLPRIDPTRSPAIMGFYVGNSAIEKYYYKHDSDVLTRELRGRLYLAPAATDVPTALLGPNTSSAID